MTAAVRRHASPYARRLARERGIGLTILSGSGPGGRIVAADVEAFVARPPVAQSTRAAQSQVSAFAATLDLRTILGLLADFGAAKVAVSLDAMLLRAAALALEAVPASRPSDSDGASDIGINWEVAGRDRSGDIAFTNPHQGLVGGIETRLRAAAESESGKVAALSLRHVAQAGVRPTVMPLLGDIAMRLVVVTDGEGPAECLLCFDESRIGEDAAADLLARFRDGLQYPLRLLA